jgi:integrase
MERAFLLLGLNCGFREKEVLGLKKNEYDLDKKILARVRKKTKVYGQWHLWAVTCDALRWAEAIRPNMVPSKKTAPVSSSKAEPVGATGVDWTARRAPVAPLGTRVNARSYGGPRVVV